MAGLTGTARLRRDYVYFELHNATPWKITEITIRIYTGPRDSSEYLDYITRPDYGLLPPKTMAEAAVHVGDYLTQQDWTWETVGAKGYRPAASEPKP